MKRRRIFRRDGEKMRWKFPTKTFLLEISNAFSNEKFFVGNFQRIFQQIQNFSNFLNSWQNSLEISNEFSNELQFSGQLLSFAHFSLENSLELSNEKFFIGKFQRIFQRIKKIQYYWAFFKFVEKFVGNFQRIFPRISIFRATIIICTLFVGKFIGTFQRKIFHWKIPTNFPTNKKNSVLLGIF